MRRNTIKHLMLALLTALIAASCSEDNTDDQDSEGRTVAVEMVISRHKQRGFRKYTRYVC